MTMRHIPTRKMRVAGMVILVLAAVVWLVTFPTWSDEASLPDDAGGECLDCHGDDFLGKTMHSPVKDQECEMCHEEGEEEHTFTIPDPISEACVSCHDDPTEVDGHVHGPVAAGECTRCHDPHASDQRALLLASTPELCWRCHRRPISRGEGQREVANIHREVTTTERLHGAVDGGCDSCHPAHGASGPRLFSRSFPAGPYAWDFENAYELCFDCHDREAIFQPETDETAFRQGMKNLHAVHVARKKSRSCVLCHSPHGGGQHLLRQSTPFGSWQLPVGYEARGAGGRCATACHETRTYSIVPWEHDSKELQELRQP